MRNVLLPLAAIALFTLLSACHSARDASGDEGTFSEFIARFPVIHAPFQYGADSLEKDYPDSLRLDGVKMKRFVPDSLWQRAKKTGKAGIFPIGAYRTGQLHVALIRVSSGTRDQADLLVYGKGDSAVAAKQVAAVDKTRPGHLYSFSLDDNDLLHLSEREQEPGGRLIVRERVYGIGADGTFSLILVNTNEPPAPGTFYNPIDTFPARHHFSGDYEAGKSDIVCIRDGDKKGTFRFFIHLDKDHGQCTGELNGVGKFTGAAAGRFQEEDGPCAVRFTFTSGAVRIAETGGCGAYRGVTCNFSGTYARKATRKRR
jgi:hypothetical protein